MVWELEHKENDLVNVAREREKAAKENKKGRREVTQRELDPETQSSTIIIYELLQIYDDLLNPPVISTYLIPSLLILF